MKLNLLCPVLGVSQHLNLLAGPASRHRYTVYMQHDHIGIGLAQSSTKTRWSPSPFSYLGVLFIYVLEEG